MHTPQHEHAERTPPTRSRVRRWLKRVAVAMALLIVLFVVVVGPWPARNGSYIGSDYQQATLARLSTLALSPAQPGPLRAGVASVDITPPAGHQLAGYANQPDKHSQSVFSHVYARALTLESASTRITMLTADVLFIHPRIAAEVLTRTGLAPGEIYFSASHTHSGPGQWAQRWLEEFAIGEYDEAFVDHLIDQFAEVVMASRKSLVSVEVGVAVAHAPYLIRARVDGINATDDRITAIIFRALRTEADAPTAPLAIFVTFAAHATAAGRDDLRLSADYPGGLVSQLRQTTGAQHVLFAAGCVGDAAPYPPKRTLNCESADEMGRALADLLTPAINAATFERDVALADVRLTVDMPSLRVPITAGLSTSPIVASLVDPGPSYVHVLRIGPVLLAGMPCDFSGGAARPFMQWASEHDLVAIVTSFNGDYHGYFMSADEFFGCPKLEQRSTFTRGPWAGEYFADLAARISAQISGAPPP